MKIQLSDREVAKLMKPVKGRGGFQSTIRRVQKNIKGNILEASVADVERLVKYAFEYGPGGFQEQAKAVADGGTRPVE